MTILLILFLELAQFISVAFLCICFFLFQTLFHKQQKSWMEAIMQWKTKTVFISLGIVEMLTLLVVLPLCDWWFTIWNVSKVEYITSIVLVVSILLFFGKMSILQRELKKMKHKKEASDTKEHPYL